MHIVLRFAWIGIKITMVMALFFMCTLCSVSMLVTVVGTNQKQSYDNMPMNLRDSYNINDVAMLLFADDVGQIRQTQGKHNGLPSSDGWDYSGWDYTTECNDTLYSPLPGAGVVTKIGDDGTGNPEIRIEGDAGSVGLLHGRYTLVTPGDIVIGGVTPIGYNDTIGNSSGCHAHISWHPNPNWNPKIYNQTGTVQHTGRHGNYGSVLSSYDGVKLRVSSYRPSEGGINCDSDCSTMASGDKVASWALGKNGVYAAACPQEWPMRTHFQLEGITYECADRGGYINCYAPGDFDPTLGGHTATDSYCWVDVLGDSGFTYGDKTDNWRFIK